MTESNESGYGARKVRPLWVDCCLLVAGILAIIGVSILGIEIDRAYTVWLLESVQ